LEGLEISEVKFSYVKLTDVFRIDSNYFQKIFLPQEKNILKNKSTQLIELGCNLKSFGAYSLNNHVEYLDEGIPFVRGINLKGGRIKFNDIIYISLEAHKLLWKSEVHPKTILLSMSGTIGDVAIASESLKYPINSNQDIAKISCSNELNPYYLYAFLCSCFGQNYLKREARGSVQQHVFLSQIERFQIPEFTHDFYESIESVIKNSDLVDKQSQENYEKAEALLLDTLGMANFSPSAEAINVKSFKDSFAATGRLDAEYYQPKYEQIMGKLTAHSHDRLVELVNIKKSIEPGSDAYSEDDEGLPFLRVADYSKYGITKPQKCLSAAFVAENCAELDALKPKKNTVLFSKDGSVGEAYCLREDANFITSGAVLHLAVLDPDHVLPEYLTLALNSRLVKMQAERDAGGSIILHWRVGEIENVVVPLVDMPTQEKIAAMVQESFTLKAESERLLDVAKRAVEIAIEQDEGAGMAYIEANS
jgi:restriction endonuclease S subunit